MASNDKKNQEYLDHHVRGLTSSDLQNILEVNKKAIEIHLEVEKQNEDILDILRQCKNKIEEIDKNLFRLVILLGSIGIGTIIGVIQLFIHK